MIIFLKLITINEDRWTINIKRKDVRINILRLYCMCMSLFNLFVIYSLKCYISFLKKCIINLKLGGIIYEN